MQNQVTVIRLFWFVNSGSYMSAHVLLNLFNGLVKRDKMHGLPSILSIFRNKFDKFNNTGAGMIDSIYHTTFKLFCDCVFRVKMSRFLADIRDVVMGIVS